MYQQANICATTIQDRYFIYRKKNLFSIFQNIYFHSWWIVSSINIFAIFDYIAASWIIDFHVARCVAHATSKTFFALVRNFFTLWSASSVASMNDLFNSSSLSIIISISENMKFDNFNYSHSRAISHFVHTFKITHLWRVFFFNELSSCRSRQSMLGSLQPNMMSELRSTIEFIPFYRYAGCSPTRLCLLYL